MRRLCLTVLLTLGPGTASAASIDLSIQEVLLRVKPAVALVVSEIAPEVALTCAGGGTVKVSVPPFRETGTGWFVSPNGWLITNGHVVAAAYRPTEWLLERHGAKATRPGCRVAHVTPNASTSVILSNGMRFRATVAKYSPPAASDEMSGQDLALLRLEAGDMPTLSLGDSVETNIGNRLHIIGFPGVVLTHELLLNTSAKVEASITNGAISGFMQDPAGRPVLQTDAAAEQGDDGGPAVSDAGRVVGVLTFVAFAPGEQDSTVQGFNFVIPAATVLDFVKGTGVKLDEGSRFNVAWYGALRDYFTGHYEQAARGFSEANRLLPDLPDVIRLRAETETKIKNPPRRPFPWAFVATGVTIVSAVLYGALLGMRWKRNRFRIKPGEVVKLLEGAEPPVILDVRETAAYAQSSVQIPNALHVSPQALESGTTRVDVAPTRTLVAYCT